MSIGYGNSSNSILKQLQIKTCCTKVLLKSKQIGACHASTDLLTFNNSIQFSFIFRHTYIFAMHNIEVHSKILDR